jgi:two-component system response regulator FixJ
VAIARHNRDTRREDEVAAIRAKLASLSPREREVLDGLVAGLPNKTIAYDLKISARTVEVHRANLMARMDAKSVADLVRMVFIVRPPSP